MGTVSRAVLLALATAGVLVVAAPASAQAADDGLDEVGTTSWRVEPASNRAVVSIELTLRNTVPDTSGGRTYFDAYGIAFPMPPTEVTVRTDGDDVSTRVDTLDDGTPVLEWDFPSRLFHDQSRTFEVVATFDSAPPRTDLDQGPRITEAFVMLPIWAWGRDGADLEVRVPAALDARLGFTDPDATEDGVEVFSRTGADDFSEFLVGASDAGDRSTEQVEVDDTTVVVEAWPDDAEWGSRVAEFAGRALPELSAWTRTPWQDDTLTIRETARPVAEGWGGWNDPDANTISVGEEFDRSLWTHELAHNWFDEEQFADTWLLEGLTEEVTESLVEELDIGSPPVPAASDQVLLDWWDILGRADNDLVDDPDAWYDTTGDLYAGAHYVVDTVADEVGEDMFREIVRMTLQDESAWGDLGHAPDPAADWREFLDLAERVAGSTTAREVVATRVRPGSEELLAQRDRAIVAFDELAEHPWGVPTSVAASMHSWRFRVVLDQIAEARAARDEVEALASRAEGRGWSVPDLQTVWRTSAPEDLADRVDALDAVIDDVEALESQADEADLPAPALDLDPAVDDPEDMTQRVDDLRSSIARVVSAERALANVEEDPVAGVGLAGTDLQGLRDRAHAAFADGDVPGVRQAVADLALVVDGATDRGRLRLGAAAGAVVVLLVVLVLTAWWYRRRSRRRADVATTTPT